MKKSLASSELILNSDGSIYHCNIRPEDLAENIILVGDPGRVEKVSKYFDRIDKKSSKREIVVHTGEMNGKRITCISTGMGTDNIDIVLNELDALANIDLEKKEIKDKLTSLNFVRLGTSGALQKDIPVDSLVASSHGLGLDGLMSYYANNDQFYNDIADEFTKQSNWNPRRSTPYIAECSKELLDLMMNGGHDNIHTGITATACGFYGPQGRVLRLGLDNDSLNDSLTNFSYKDYRITNFEMETSGIYSLSQLMGHKALSLNTIIANRLAGQFSTNPYVAVDKMIEYALNLLTK